ncbi:unnamed protein product [Effrenium voratum]|nr:unnamed protein product [Effrenium voratum]
MSCCFAWLKDLGFRLSLGPGVEHELDADEESGGELAEAPAARPLLTRRGGVSAEPTGANNVRYADWHPPFHQKTPEQRQRLHAALERCPLFQGFAAHDLSRIVDAIEITRVETGDQIYVKGEIGRSGYVLISGSACAETDAQDDHALLRRSSKFKLLYEEGDFFGEHTMLWGFRRRMTVDAVTSCILGKLRRDVYFNIAARAAMAARSFRETCLRAACWAARSLCHDRGGWKLFFRGCDMFAQWKVNQAGAGVLLLRGARVIANCIHVFAFATEVPIFETFDDELIARIADIVERRLYREGEKIIQQGQPVVQKRRAPLPGEAKAELFIVASGECEATILVDKVGFGGGHELEEHAVRRYQKGERFGELGFIHRSRRAASVTATQESELFCLDRDTFERIVELELKQQENYASDPRKAIADFYSPGDHRGPGGVASGAGSSQWFAVYRPTSRDALAKMLNQTAVGKGLNVKGKSAKKNHLSGFVPFLQISDNNHKKDLEASPPDAWVTIYFQTRESQEAAHKELERVHMSVADSPAPIVRDDEFPAVYGLRMPETIMRKVYIDTADLQFQAGWETGRASEPAFMDMNLHALRKAKSDPKIVLYQYDATNELNPHGLLIAYAEEHEVAGKKIKSVKPVVSDFDTFTVGSRGVTYERLPEHQVDLMIWSLEQTRAILSQPGTKSWTSRWLEVLQKANQEGFHPTLPQYGFGDPTSYKLIEEVIKATHISGAVRHGAECFNFYFPQELDSEYLVVWDGFKDKPWAYHNQTELQDFLASRIQEGYSFPINPVWPLRDEGWYAIFDALVRAGACLNSWFPPERRIVELVEEIRSTFPDGFQVSCLKLLLHRRSRSPASLNSKAVTQIKCLSSD